MTVFWLLIAIAAVAAMADWFAVGTAHPRLEYAAKPSVLVALTVAAAVIPADQTDLVDRRWWFVGALACCLIGDVFLMLPRDLFVPGLTAFLAGHLLFVVGLLQPPSPPGNPPFSFSAVGLLAAAVAVIAVEALFGVTLIRSLAAHRDRSLIAPVLLYMAAIAVMVVLATNVGVEAAAAGSVLFLLSDTLLSVDRFVRAIPGGPLAVHVTYHLAQFLLVLSLVH